MSERRMDDALRASYQEFVEEIRTTTDMRQALASVHARIIGDSPPPARPEISAEQSDSTSRRAGSPPTSVAEQPASTHVVPNVRLIHRLLLAVDVEKYSARDVREQLRAQTDLRNILSIAAENIGLDRNQWYEQVTGDGELAVLPENADVSLVVGDFTRQLQLVLAEFNQQHTRSPRLRIRVAMHHGTLSPGPLGPAGDAPFVVSRLLNAKPLRRVLVDHPDRDVALIVSSSLYRDVVRTGFCSLDPGEFQAVRFIAKGELYQGFIQRAPSPPVRSEAIRAVPDTVLSPVSAAENAADADSGTLSPKRSDWGYTLVALLSKIFDGTADKVGEQLWESLAALVLRIFGKRSTSLEAIKRLGERPGDPNSIKALTEALAADAARDPQADAQLRRWVAAAEQTIAENTTNTISGTTYRCR